MSREVRRVPLDWKHPVVVNEHYEFQRSMAIRRGNPPSRLLDPGMRFVGLMDDYPHRRAEWEQEVRDVANRQGHHWIFSVEYHLTGYQGRDDAFPAVHPFYVWWSEDGDEERPVTVRDEDHLWELEIARVVGEQPDPANYMPVWSEDEATGWCLYETVSEGTPTTPVFATAEDLIDHLATVGQDYEQVPMRRTAAETLVRQGSSFGSFLVMDGDLLRSADDADIIADRLAVRP